MNYISGTYQHNMLNYTYYTETETAIITGGFGTGAKLVTNVTVLGSFVIDGTTYTVTGIGESAFNSWINLASISLPSTIETMGIGCFGSCSNLTSFTIPPLVTTIEHGSFISCTSLTSITIPPNVTSMLAIFNGRHGGSSSGAFQNCTSLVDIVMQTYITNFGEVFFR